MPARLQEHYTKTVREALTKEFSYKNAFEVPTAKPSTVPRPSSPRSPARSR